MGLLKNYNKLRFLKASSLLESVMAITVLSICGLVAIKIYASVLDNSYSYNYLSASSKIDELIFESQDSKNHQNQDLDFGDFKIKKRVETSSEKYIKVSFFGVLKNDTIQKTIKIYKGEN